MSKRFQPLKEFGRTTKKPKLDITVNKTRPEKDENPQPKQQNVIAWDDDEDDVIMLATQVAESEIASKGLEMTDSEITFSEFEPKAQQHSTQQQPPIEPQNDILSQMFDDDEVFAKLAAAVDKEAETLKSQDVFKRPELPSCSKVRPAQQQAPERNEYFYQNTITQTDTSTSSRRQVAADRQIDFLKERLDALKQENSQLCKDLNDVKDNMEAKSGEASMLRDELRRARQQIESLKMEKLLQTEVANAESKNKIEQLAKEVKEKESQLQLKSVECSVLKMRQADESRRLDQSVQEMNVVASSTTTKPSTDQDFIRMLSFMRLNDFDVGSPPKKIESESACITKNAFERAFEHGVSRKLNTFFQQELENLQRILTRIKITTEPFDDETAEQLTESVRKVFSEFWSYIQKLDYQFHENLLPYHSYDIMMDESKRESGCLHSKTQLYDGERGLNIRRYIAALSAICQESMNATRAILNAKHEEHPLLQIMIDGINKLGYSIEIILHFGIIEACAILMQSLLLHIEPDENAYLDVIFNLLKSLVFALPNPWSLYEISFTVLDCAHRFNYALSKFCVNSEKKHFISNRSNYNYRFSIDACFLEVYCGLLETAFPLYQPLSETHFELQANLCLNHVRFVFNCLTEPPHFVEKMIPLDETASNDSKTKTNVGQSTVKENENVEKATNLMDDVPSTSKQALSAANKTGNSSASNSSLNGTSNKTKITCLCFTQLCLSVVSMIWLTLRQWLRMNKDYQTPRVALISRIAVHVLYLIFCEHCFTCIFRHDEDTTKHYLYLICTWWEENVEEIKFTDIQLKMLQKLRNCSAFPKNLIDEETNLKNIENDLEQWRQMTNDKDCVLGNKSLEDVIKDLRLFEDAFDPEKFFKDCYVDNEDLDDLFKE